MHGTRDVEQPFEGKGLALRGSVGQRAFAHSFHALGCPKEVWGRLVSSSSFYRKSPWSSVSWSNKGPLSQPKQWKHVPWLGCA